MAGSTCFRRAFGVFSGLRTSGRYGVPYVEMMVGNALGPHVCICVYIYIYTGIYRGVSHIDPGPQKHIR